MSYTAPMKIVRAAARGARSFSKVHDDLDLDIAQAHADATIAALLRDEAAYNRAVRAAEGDHVKARAIVEAYFGLKG